MLLGGDGINHLFPRGRLRTYISSPIEANLPEATGRLERVEVGINGAPLQSATKGARLGANLGYFYLQKELKLSEHHMVKIMEKYPWIMYLKVDTNLRPTVEVLKSFGFRDKDVRSMLETVPPILGINHEWTLPEKLISIQKMFNLNRAGLVKLVVHQPFLLTCSIDRNIRVSEFLSEVVGLSPEGIRNCLLCCPEVAMSGITKMSACWSVLTDIYGLSDKQARALVMYYPIVLTHRTLKTIQDKVSFFSEELNMSPPFREVQKVIMRYPQLLCIDPNVFMRPNVALLKIYLDIDRDGISKLISFFPSALGYNPRTLEKSLRKSLFMLTGLDEYNTVRGNAQDVDDDDDDLRIFEGEEQDVSHLGHLDLRRGPLSEQELETIESVATNILDVKDGDILSLHILPSSMDPFRFMSPVENDVEEPHLVISNSYKEGLAQVQLATGLDDVNTYTDDENQLDEYDDEDDVIEVQDNMYGNSVSYEKASRREDREEYQDQSVSPPHPVGVDVLADIVDRSKSRYERNNAFHAASIADVIQAAVSVTVSSSAVSTGGAVSTDAHIHAPISSGVDASKGLEFDSITSEDVDVTEMEGRTPDCVHHIDASSAPLTSHTGAVHELEATRLMMLVYSTLNIDKTRAINVVKCAPWVLSYRPERSLRTLSTIGFSLGMSRTELSRLVRSYPRVLSLSVDGKISEVLTALGNTAETCLSLQDSEEYMTRSSLFKVRKGVPQNAEESDGDAESELVQVILNLCETASTSTSTSTIVNSNMSDSFSSSFDMSEDDGGRGTTEGDTERGSVGGGGVSPFDVDVDAVEKSTQTMPDGAIMEQENGSEDLITSQEMGVACSSITLSRRRDPVRTMVRTAILKWPLLLGTSMGKINTGIEELLALQIPFDQLIQIVRRSPKTQSKWKNKVLCLVEEAKRKRAMKLKKEEEKRSRDEDSSRTYYEHEIYIGDVVDEPYMDCENEMEVLILREEEKKKVKLEKTKRKVALIKKIKKVLLPEIERSGIHLPMNRALPGPRKSPNIAEKLDDINSVIDTLSFDVDSNRNVKKKKVLNKLPKKSKSNPMAE